jgi:hypothetical protein
VIRSCVAALVLAVVFGEAEASACPPPGKPGPWVRVAVEGDAAGPIHARAIARLLGAELAARGIVACDEPSVGAPAPIAQVVVHAPESGQQVTVAVDVRDAVTAKSVQRDVELASVPPDGRALTVALAADELLRASWAELAMRAAPPPRAPVPPEVTAAVRDALPAASPGPRRPPRFAFGAGAAVDTFAAGTTLLGADVLADVWIVPRLRVSARLGLRSGLVVHAADGDVSTTALVFALGAAVTLTPPALRFGLDATLGAGAIRASFAATPAAPATAQTLTDVAVVGDAGLAFWFRLAPRLRAYVDVAAAAPLRPIEATDGGLVIAGISGPGFSSALALRGTF